MSLEMAHKVILPPKKNYIPQFLKQRDINSYYSNTNRTSIYGSKKKKKTELQRFLCLLFWHLSSFYSIKVTGREMMPIRE
jgi:hypothetical protein